MGCFQEQRQATGDIVSLIFLVSLSEVVGARLLGGSSLRAHLQL